MPTVKIEGLSKALDKIFQDNKKITVAGANRALRATIVKNWGDVIKSTPVGDTVNGITGGSARGNWQVTMGMPATSEGKKSKTKGDNYVLRNTSREMFGNKWFLTNNLPYIVTLEFGGYGTKSANEEDSKVTPQGFSKQAPAGMVRINTARFPSQLARAFKGAV